MAWRPRTRSTAPGTAVARGLPSTAGIAHHAATTHSAAGTDDAVAGVGDLTRRTPLIGVQHVPPLARSGLSPDVIGPGRGAGDRDRR
ncbi:hypothetical protein ABZY42_05905 [Streptomyces sp. NPDC006622]|uniref:hypothetical protein n=1 Tax=Streptomyces sp. NPDC006622 TaxID=3155459 RepID=UPI0033A3D854